MSVARHHLRVFRTLLQTRQVGTDACGIPLKPTWSLRELMSSYPSPPLSAATFQRLHELSALVPPTEGTHEYDATKKELDELVRLVEAVKLINVDRPTGSSIPDGRVYAESTRIPLTKEPLDEEIQGTKLLHYANRTLDGMYVVETDRER
ncbi:hypothetical protein J3R83DRAFT_1072 [Lanmaoa asiatica]|nr:hypothetical protein J3R83DRAFT_1072 [Lanmaoa asiatica]